MKKMKRLTLFGLLTFISFSVIGIECFKFSYMNLKPAEAEKTYQLKIDESTDFNNVYTSDGNKIEFELIDFIKVPGRVGKLTLHSRIKMLTPLNGIKNIALINESGQNYAMSKYIYQFKDGKQIELFNPDSTFSFNVTSSNGGFEGRYPNLIELYDHGEQVVKQIIIDYTCQEQQEKMSLYQQQGNRFEIIKSGSTDVTNQILTYNVKKSSSKDIIYFAEYDFNIGDKFRIKREDGFYHTYLNTKCLNIEINNGRPIEDFLEILNDNYMQVKLRFRLSIEIDVLNYNYDYCLIRYLELEPLFTSTLIFEFEERIPTAYRPVIYSNIPGFEGANQNMSEIEKLNAMEKTSCTTLDTNRKHWELAMPNQDGARYYSFQIFILPYGTSFDKTEPTLGTVNELLGDNDVYFSSDYNTEIYRYLTWNKKDYIQPVGEFSLYDINYPANKWIFKKRYGTENEYNTLQMITKGSVLEAYQIINGELYIGKFAARANEELYGLTIKNNKIYANEDLGDLKLFIMSTEGDATSNERYVNIEVVSYPIQIIGPGGGTVVVG